VLEETFCLRRIRFLLLPHCCRQDQRSAKIVSWTGFFPLEQCITATRNSIVWCRYHQYAEDTQLNISRQGRAVTPEMFTCQYTVALGNATRTTAGSYRISLNLAFSRNQTPFPKIIIKIYINHQVGDLTKRAKFLRQRFDRCATCIREM
jgi:hypothetical protein